MAYCVEADIEGLIAQWTIDATSKPTSTQLVIIISGIDGEINGVLSAKGITVPFASSGDGDQNAFASYLTGLCSWGGAAVTLKSKFPDVIGPGDVPAYQYFETKYQKGLKMLKDGSVIPKSVSASADAVAPSTMNTRNPDSDEDLGAKANPAFSRDQVVRGGSLS